MTFEVRERKTRSEAPRRLVVVLRVLSSIVHHPFAGTGKAWVRQLDHDLPYIVDGGRRQWLSCCCRSRSRRLGLELEVSE